MNDKLTTKIADLLVDYIRGRHTKAEAILKISFEVGTKAEATRIFNQLIRTKGA